MYFSGGTELITLGRIDLTYTEAVIDIKNIPELHLIQVTENQLILGSALTLTKVEEANLFPLLTEDLKRSSRSHSKGENYTWRQYLCPNFLPGGCSPFSSVR